MTVAITGTRGIPNRYGGFEQFATVAAPLLAARGHRVSVYNASSHPCTAGQWEGVELIYRCSPERWLGAAAQFIYDLLCILDCRRRRFDLIIQLGYTTSSLWGFLLPRHSRVATNMDGMEWQRSQYGRMTRRFLRWAEHRAVTRSDLLIADALEVQRYLTATYGRQAVYIPYGAFPVAPPDLAPLAAYGLQPYAYDLAIGRPVAENNQEMIVCGHLRAHSTRKLMVVGLAGNRYARRLRRSYSHPRLVFQDAVYDTKVLNCLRYYSRLYFHGHSAGGTNPSLLEAMAARCMVAAHDNPFNREVLGPDAYYFSSEAGVTALVEEAPAKVPNHRFIRRNLEKLNLRYSWPHIIDLMETLITPS